MEGLEGDGGVPGSQQCGLLRKNLHGRCSKPGVRSSRPPGGCCFAQERSEHVPIPPKRREKSPLRSMVRTSLSRPPGKTPTG